MTTLIDGKAAAARIRARVAAAVTAEFPDPARTPGLATVM